MKSKKIIFLTGIMLLFLGVFPNIVLSDSPPVILYDIDILTPENILYEPPLNTGHYPATYSFEDEADNTYGTTIDFVDTADDGGIYTKILSEYDGHKKVLRTYQSTGWSYASHYFGTTKLSGTTEYWIQVDDATQKHNFQLREAGSNRIALRIENDKFLYKDTNQVFQPIQTCHDDQWYRIKTVWRSDSGFDLYIDGVPKLNDMPFSYSMTGNGLDEFYWKEYDGYSKFYLDAIGYSWENYFIGDNEGEGLELTWDCPNNLLEARYNLDSRGWQTVEGVTYIPVTEEVDHIIKMEGIDAQENIHRSYDRTFYYGFSEKIGVLL